MIAGEDNDTCSGCVVVWMSKQPYVGIDHSNLGSDRICDNRTVTRQYTRREFVATTSCAIGSHVFRAGGIQSRSQDRPTPRFQTILPIPSVLRPTQTDKTTECYNIVQKEAVVELLPGKRTAIWGYEGMFPGPTIKVSRGRRTTVRHINRLSIPTVVHLHGGLTPPDSDGFPVDLVMPGKEKTYFYPNERAATLWYHDHAIDHTGRNIFMGLAGLYIVESEHEKNLPLPKDDYDVPLILQDRLFSADGALLYQPDYVDGPKTDTILVNGAPWPRMEVSARQYRFRLLNASNARSFHLALSSASRLCRSQRTAACWRVQDCSTISSGYGRTG